MKTRIAALAAALVLGLVLGLIARATGHTSEHPTWLGETLATVGSIYISLLKAAVVPLVQLDHDQWLLELFHGPTLAFKDVALQLLGLFFERFLAGTSKRLTIVGATSGDTGSAAIDAVAGPRLIRIAKTDAASRRSATSSKA